MRRTGGAGAGREESSRVLCRARTSCGGCRCRSASRRALKRDDRVASAGVLTSPRAERTETAGQTPGQSGLRAGRPESAEAGVCLWRSGSVTEETGRGAGVLCETRSERRATCRPRRSRRWTGPGTGSCTGSRRARSPGTEPSLLRATQVRRTRTQT